MQEIMAKVNRSKIEPEIANLNVACNFTEWTFKNVIRDLESYIEKDVKIKHKKISGNAERMLDDNEKLASFLNKHAIKDSQLLEFPLAILI
jgi:nucleosome binding factor SPN SPT16 subunit